MSGRAAVFVALLVGGGAALVAILPSWVAGLWVALAVFSATWIVSLVVGDAGIVDVLWGPALVLLAWFAYVSAEGDVGWRGLVAAGMISLWGARLALHLAVRGAGRGEDFRYRAWRDSWGRSFWWRSLLQIFLLQGAVAWVVAAPAAAAQHGNSAVFGVLDVAGLALWAFGLVWEAAADWQLLVFQRDPESRGKVLSSGLWALSRHPNYFGEAVLWWGIGLIGLAAGGAVALVGPILLTFLLLKVSGVPMLDEGLARQKDGYEEYVRSTPAFLPVPRRLRA